MKNNVIEVFIEKNCRSCEEVLRAIESLVDQFCLSLHVYDRQMNRDVFLAKSVMVCPATFVNNRLAFYGSFSSEELSRYIKSQTINHSQQGVKQ
ncbi:MAG TPA: thioredoxin family protein [Bacteroidota bacterium]|nr:thioredoxin family protein [Bacteroidota bacterium]HLE31488.1 thioredoxin family protein [Bacteroidota bacterium]